MTRYRRIRLGGLREKDLHGICKEGGYAGVDYSFHEDLTGKFKSSWREFNDWFIPYYQENIERKSKGSLGLAGGAIWTFCVELQLGDYILSPDSNAHFHVGRVAGDYYYVHGERLPHRRKVDWTGQVIDKDSFSDNFRASVRGPLTNIDIDKYSDEIESLLDGGVAKGIRVLDDDVEDPIGFALELHLEEFLVRNWARTEFGRSYDLFEEDGEVVGRQFPTDTGPIDILAISKDKRKILVIELKRGRASDVVVGQIQRYMGYVMEDVAEDGQEVEGAIVALEADPRIKRALMVTNNINFFRYKVDFELSRVL